MVSSSDPYEQWWSDLCENYSPFVLDCILPYTTNIVIFTLTNVPFTCMDILGCPKKLEKYRLQPSESKKQTDKIWKRLPANLSVALFNVYIIGFLLYFLTYMVRKWNGYVVPRTLPSAVEFVRDAAICIAVEEITFYYGHRLFHQPFFYKLIHKQHHRWSSPISLASRYCNPIEHVVSYDGPVLLGLILTNAHTLTTMIWCATGVFTSVCHHCGYQLPFIPAPAFHDMHHETFNANYGILGTLDIIHGTETFYSSRPKVKRESHVK